MTCHGSKNRISSVFWIWRSSSPLQGITETSGEIFSMKMMRSNGIEDLRLNLNSFIWISLAPKALQMMPKAIVTSLITNTILGFPGRFQYGVMMNDNKKTVINSVNTTDLGKEENCEIPIFLSNLSRVLLFILFSRNISKLCSDFLN